MDATGGVTSASFDEDVNVTRDGDDYGSFWTVPIGGGMRVDRRRVFTLSMTVEAETREEALRAIRGYIAREIQ